MPHELTDSACDQKKQSRISVSGLNWSTGVGAAAGVGSAYRLDCFKVGEAEVQSRNLSLSLAEGGVAGK